MTEANDPNAGHLDLETLADLDEGLLSQEQTAAAQAHLEGCDQCRDDLAALTSVRELLASDATSLTMPDDVAARVHEALAAEQPLSPPADEEPPVQPWAPAAVTTLPERARDRERRRNQWLAGLSVAAVIALFAVGISVLPHSSESKSAGASAATSAAPAVSATTSGRNYTKAGLADQALGLIGQGGAAASSSAAGASSAAASSAPASAAPASAGGSSAPASSAASAPASSAASSSAAASAATGGGKTPAGAGQDTSAAGVTSAATSSSPAPTPSTDVLAPLRKPGAAQACLSSYASAAGAPLAIDFATFEGKPAVIGIFNDPNHPGQYEVVAVGPPGCSLYEFAFPKTP